jgi:hypothetical protein
MEISSMNMMGGSQGSNVTRIADLPENQVMPTFMEPVKTRSEPNMQSAPSYKPILDVHPNPYGVPKPNAPVDFSQPLQPRYSGEINSDSTGGTNIAALDDGFDTSSTNARAAMRLYEEAAEGQFMPSRDIPQNTIAVEHVQDEQIRVNYIPKPKLTTDFILENSAEIDEEKWQKHRQESYRSSRLDALLSDSQMPFYIAILFLLFHLPATQNLIFHYLSFSSFPLFDAEGVPNIAGKIVMSALFGLAYYGSLRLLDFFDE